MLPNANFIVRRQVYPLDSLLDANVKLAVWLGCPPVAVAVTVTVYTTPVGVPGFPPPVPPPALPPPQPRQVAKNTTETNPIAAPHRGRFLGTVSNRANDTKATALAGHEFTPLGRYGQNGMAVDTAVV
jgi:hypothetical protein